MKTAQQVELFGIIFTANPEANGDGRPQTAF